MSSKPIMAKSASITEGILDYEHEIQEEAQDNFLYYHVAHLDESFLDYDILPVVHITKNIFNMAPEREDYSVRCMYDDDYDDESYY